MIVHRRKRGGGVVNDLINRLPFEVHIPGYQYCGPGTKLTKRLARGDPGINPLDAACKEHDIAYSQTRENPGGRKAADKVLMERARKRVSARDAKFGEKAAAWGIAKTMKVKTKLGMGVRRSRATLGKIIKAAKKSMLPNKESRMLIKTALKGARNAVKKAGGKRKIVKPRILPVPTKLGGFLPLLIPIFAGLSAAGALAGGAASIAKAVNDAKAASRKLEESRRHNSSMEDIAIGKGLHLKPYKQGLGLHLKSNGGGGGNKKSKN